MAKIQRPDRVELILYLFDKLDSERVQEVDALLESDQDLDNELCQIESEICNYIAKNNLYKLSKSAEDSYKDFVRKYSALLDQPESLSALNYRQSHESHLTKLKTLLAGGRQLVTRRSLLFASIIIVGFIAYFFFYHKIHTVTAEEFVQNVIKAETARVGNVTQPILYSRVRIQKRSSGKVREEIWKKWQDVQKNKVIYQVSNPSNKMQSSDKGVSEIGGQLVAVFRQNHFEHLFSANAYNEWRNTVRQKTDEINKFEISNNQSGFELTTNTGGSHSVNSIITASLVVDSNWQIVSQQIKVQGSDEIIEYSFRAIDSKILSRSEVNVNFDSDDTYPITLSEVEAKSQEDSVRIIKNKDSELKLEAESNKPANYRSLTITATGNSQLQNRLQQYFINQGMGSDQSEQKVIELSRIVVIESNTAYMLVRELKRLDYSKSSGESNPRVNDISRDYVKRIREHCKVIGAQLRPALISITGRRTINNELNHPNQIQDELVKSVEQLFKQLNTHFASSNSDDPEQSAREILNTLAYIDSLLTN